MKGASRKGSEQLADGSLDQTQLGQHIAVGVSSTKGHLHVKSRVAGPAVVLTCGTLLHQCKDWDRAPTYSAR